MKDVLIPEGYYTTVEDFAYNKGLSPATVRRHCVDGTLKAVKIGKAWLVRVQRPAPNFSGLFEDVCMIPACGCSGKAHP